MQVPARWSSWYRLVMAGGLAIVCTGGWASLVVVINAPTQVRLRIGSTAGTVNLVTFTVPAGAVGNSAVVAGVVTPAGGVCPANQVLVDAEARAAPANSRTATLSVDSSIALTDGTNSIPFSEIAWTSSGFAPVTIPSGAFSGAGGQALATWQNSRRNQACFAFRYLNSQIFSAGIYNGRARFTLAMP